MVRTLSDPLSQYIALRTYYARKSTDDASGEESSFVKGKAAASKPVARIEADCSRVYWPGQQVSATISIDEGALDANGALEELVAEVKGEVHSFIYVYTSTGAPVPASTTIPIFSHSTTLFSRNGSRSAESPTMYAEPAQAKADGARAWHVSTTLPLTFTADDGKEYDLPPTFKDTSTSPGSGTSFVVYSIKAVAKRGATFKRDSRTWIPILVTSLAGQSLNPASLVMPPPVAAPGAMPSLPIEWQSLTATQVIKKALFRDRGEVEAQIYSPPLSCVSPGTPIPFLLRLVVRTKAKSDTAAVAPALPFSGSKNVPTFRIKRLVRNRTKKSKIGTTKLDLNSKIAVHVDWTNGHWDGASSASAATTSETVAIAGPGHGWTPNSYDAKASFSYSSTALLSGVMTIPLSPSFELPTLSVTYTLRLNIPLDGLRNTLDEQLCIVRAGSGITAQEVGAVDAAETSRRAVGTRRASLLQALNNMQGDEEEIQKLDELAKLPGYGDGDEEEESWIDEKGGDKNAKQDRSHELPEYQEAVDGMENVKLADRKH